MVLHLVRNVSLDIGQLRRAHCKCPIALLPRKLHYTVFMYPQGRTTFHLPNDISQRVRRLQSQQNVDMISWAANRPSNGANVADNSTDISMQFFTPWFRYDPPTAFRAKDDVVVKTQMG